MRRLLDMRAFLKSGHSVEHETALVRFNSAQAYQRSKIRAGTIAAGAAAVMAVVLTLWMIPYVPIGMRQDDYSSAVWVALVLAMGIAVMGLLAVLTREPASGERDVAELWQNLMGKRRRMRNPRQFYNRLTRECARVQRDQRLSLSLVVVRVSQDDEPDGQGGPGVLEAVEQILARNVRSSDVTGLVGDDEIGVLAIGVPGEEREVMIERLQRALERVLTGSTRTAHSREKPVVSLGASTLGLGDDPDSLLAAARQALRPVGARAAQAA
jgi:GGDEF domain-containing protein